MEHTSYYWKEISYYWLDVKGRFNFIFGASYGHPQEHDSGEGGQKSSCMNDPFGMLLMSYRKDLFIQCEALQCALLTWESHL